MPPNSFATDDVISYVSNDLLKRLKALTDATLTEYMLASMGIYRGLALVLDHPDPSLFFQPLEGGPKFEEAVKTVEDEFDSWGYCPVKAEHNDRLVCAYHTIDWFESICDELVDDDDDSEFHLDTATGNPKWIRVGYGQNHQYPKYSANDEFRIKTGSRPPKPLPEWHTYTASALKDMRHIKC